LIHEKGKLRFALLLIDLVRFRQINDALGRAGGDQVLMEAATRLRSLDSVLTLARFDGNVFALLVAAVEDDATLVTLIRTQVMQVFREPFLVSDQEVSVSGTIGVATFPADGARTDALITKAEVALKKAKASLEPYLF